MRSLAQQHHLCVAGFTASIESKASQVSAIALSNSPSTGLAFAGFRSQWHRQFFGEPPFLADQRYEAYIGKVFAPEFFVRGPGDAYEFLRSRIGADGE